MECRTLKITLISGHNIGPGEGQVKVYAEVSLRGDPPATAQKTHVDKEGGTNPKWNSTFTRTILDLSVQEPGLDLQVVVKLYYQGTPADMFVGEVKIPIPAPFHRGIRASATFNVVPTGRLNVSYGFGEKFSLRNQLVSWWLNRRLRSGQDSKDRRGAKLLFDSDTKEHQELDEKRGDGNAFLVPRYRARSLKMNNEAMSKVVLNLGVRDEKEKRKVMKAVSSLKGVESLSMDMNTKKLTIVGEVDPIEIAGILKKYCHTEVLTVGRAKEPEKEDEGGSVFRFGTRDGGQIKEINDEAKSDRNKRFLEDFILFCSIFPLDYEFTKDILICQWIAGGLIELGEDEETKEVCTAECFDTLMDMNYIIPSGYDYVLDQTRYKIGDKMTTFLQNQLLEPKFGKYLDSKQSHHDLTKVELLSLTFKEIDHAKVGVLKQYSRLHTLVIHDYYEVDHLPSELFSELKSLKILNLSRTNIVELPSSVENLKELRFLDISNTPLVWLPESICSLTHLQTLKLDGCLQLEGLPEGTSNLINLRHLILDVVRQLESIPVGIGKLSNLRTLSAFLVGEEKGCSVTELKNMNKLRGTFRLLNLENVGTKEEASEAYLHNKVDLRKIELQWSDVENEKIPHEEEILESLKPAVGIQELKIMFYSGGVLPSWICDPSFKNLATIFLYKCRYCISLSSLGKLPSLKHLSIIENNVMVEIDSSFGRKQRNQYRRAAFPKLEKLTFESMSRLEKWTGLEKGDFPSLQRLTIKYCPEFVGLPYLSRLVCLSHLEIIHCPELSLLPEDKLPPSLQSLMIKESPTLKEWCCDKDLSKIAHVHTVYFDHQKFPPEM